MTGSLYMLTEELFSRACYPMAMIWRVEPGLIRLITVQQSPLDEFRRITHSFAEECVGGVRV